MILIKKAESKAVLAGYLVLIPLDVLLATLFSLMLQPIIDSGLAQDWRAFFACSAGIIVVGLLSTSANCMTKYLALRIRTGFEKELKCTGLYHIMKKSAHDYYEKDTSAYLSRLTVEAGNIAEKYCGSMLEIYRILWTFLFSVAAIICADWKLAIIIVLFSVISVNLPRLFQRRTDEAESRYLKNSDSYISAVQNILGCFLLSKVFGLLPKLLPTHEKSADSLRQADISRNVKKYLTAGLASGVTQLSFIFTLIFTMILVMRGIVSIGYVMSVTQLLGGVMMPFELLPAYLLTYRTGKKEFQKSNHEFLNAQPPGKNQIPFRRKNEIEICHLDFRYKDVQILDDISLVLDMGKKYAVVGESGSGKSTLAKLLMGFLTPCGGQILINGVNIGGVSDEVLFRWLTWQEQRVTLLNDTVENNILLGKEIAPEQWENVIRLSHLEEVLRRIPGGSLGCVGEGGKNLSGGEIQRIGLARCLLSGAKFFVFDEITASLDNENACSVENNILRLPDTGALVITHRLNPAIMEQYDGIFVLDGGKIAESGTYGSLMEKKGKFYALATAQPD